ncbi:AraC family transcriptional regulator [Paenibacillus sp. ATY16]|uniref:AraC family transcriptional regulator n=1 Tax=Paenibacillus sp. ATY16 TaxID=1759312 RepID=UPI00200D4D60|nr:AraC family transcriptional regulator [Paenibacillus sp. ATY16]MCK9858947.1 AraC family transcriptional regulator [Paenibacillus sp. ATY16]
MKAFHYNSYRSSRDNPDFYLSYWGKEDCSPNHAFGPGIRDHYKVHFVHRGTGTVQVGGSTFKLTSGQAFLAYPGKVISYQADAIDPWSYSWIGFRGEQVGEVLERTKLTSEEPVFPMDKQLMPNLYELLLEAANHPRNHDLRLTSLLIEFLTVLIDSQPSSADGSVQPRKQDTYIHRSLDFIHSHFSEPITVQQMAASLGLDRKYLSFLFKEAMGLPPQQYLLNYRMDRAGDLLRKGEYSIGEVARSVGYQDALLFSKMFKKLKGVPPKLYR